ncbi:MAG: FGGY-family carbohydrate kinase, partial [Eubacteriales bacterium]|nr:FGGY-family carbohydrate kinase [Eubacteriales bacterium]
MDQQAIRQAIAAGQTSIGIELGSTRIKSVLTGPDLMPAASGSFDWENSQVDGIWTYSLEDVWHGLQNSFAALAADVKSRYDLDLTTTGAIGISGMMHGYLAFDQEDQLLVPFRTWRNTITGPASEELTELFNYPVPQRWSIAHLYQAIKNGEDHVGQIAYLTTLAGYVHWQLTGEKVMGVGEASGMFPIDLATRSFNTEMASQFDALVTERQYPWQLLDILPQVQVAGEKAGALTAAGARLLDPAGKLTTGIPFCPPEGDAGTGMVATNSIAPRTGNVSAGTSVFAMIVLEKELSRAYAEIDQVTTPDGNLVAMVHSNNCSSDYDAWIGLFAEAVKALGFAVSKPQLYDTLLGLALAGDPDCGGLLAFGYLSGEHITGFEEGRPLFVRSAGSAFNLGNFMRVHLSTALGALHTGLGILLDHEGVQVDEIKGHGGFFKTKEVGQRIMAAATGVPVSVLETAGEGGAWGIALLAAFAVKKEQDLNLADFLNQRVFVGQAGSILVPTPKEVAGFKDFMARYQQGLAIERAAVESLH